jgi:hypothetical protein
MSSLDVKSLTTPHCLSTSKLLNSEYAVWLFQNVSKNFDFCSISLVFGIVTIASGLLGVVCGSVMGQKLRVQFPSAGTINSFHLQRIHLIALTFIYRRNHLRSGNDLQRTFFLRTFGPLFGTYLCHLHPCLPGSLVY